MADLAPAAQMAACEDAFSDSGAPGEPFDDPARAAGADAFAKEPSDDSDMGSFPRRVGSRVALRRQFLLYGLPVCAASRSRAQASSTPFELAAPIAHEVAFYRPLCRRAIRL